jgi:murein DD-endopeptidase MepM/ murein hydrolase activator NlpD
MDRTRTLLVSIALLCAALSTPLYARDVIRHVLADGFDYPVGIPDAKGYYKYRGYTPNGHLGEDWNGVGGGDTDLGDPIYSVAHGVVVFSDDVRKGWGNCVIVRHAYRDESGKIRYVDSQYGHLLKRYVKLYDRVKRGQQIGEMGSNRGMYVAHLHFEMRKELRLGMNRSAWPRDNSCYYHPTNFIKAHRKLRTSSKVYPIAVNTFYGQGELGRDPRLKNLEVTIAKEGLDPIEERKPKEKNSVLKNILSKLRSEKSEKSDESIEKMRKRVEK